MKNDNRQGNGLIDHFPACFMFWLNFVLCFGSFSFYVLARFHFMNWHISFLCFGVI